MQVSWILCALRRRVSEKLMIKIVELPSGTLSGSIQYYFHDVWTQVQKK